MSKGVRDARWRDSVIAARVFQARGVNGRDDRDDTPRKPAEERVRHLHREHIVGDSDQDETISSVPSIDDQRSAERAELAEATRFFDRLLAVALRQQAPQQADAESAATAVD